MNKIRVAILFGGRSAEHEVSIRSAENVAAALNKEKYESVLVGIDRLGKWHLNCSPKMLETISNTQQSRAMEADSVMAINQYLLAPKDGSRKIDVVFPVLHGPYGEDGSIQGLFKIAGIPFVGPGVLGSAVGMDKDVMKRLFRDAGLPSPKFIAFSQKFTDEISYKTVTQVLGSPIFVKPANLGSSVGVRKVFTENDFIKAIEIAFTYDTKVIVEEFISGREIECAILGNESPQASLPGEVVVHDDFYSYDAKYNNPNAATLEIPAKLSSELTKKIQDLAIQAFKVLGCEGMARVDMFLTTDGDLLLNEINTIPGFTNISMYPKLWEISGVPYTELLDRLIMLAFERFERDNKLQTHLFANQIVI